MMEDFVEAAGWAFFSFSFFLFCWEPCSKQIFVLPIAFLFLFFIVIYSSMLQMLVLLDVLNFMVNLLWHISYCCVDMFTVFKFLWQQTLDHLCNSFWCSWLDMFLVCMLHVFQYDNTWLCHEVVGDWKRVYSCRGLRFTMNWVAQHFNAVQFFGLVLKLQSFLVIQCIIPHFIMMKLSWLNQHFGWRCCFKSPFKNNL